MIPIAKNINGLMIGRSTNRTPDKIAAHKNPHPNPERIFCFMVKSKLFSSETVFFDIVQPFLSTILI
jgi:hypothetical protein